MSERRWALVEYEADSPLEMGRTFSAITMIRSVKRVHDADVTGLSKERLDVITGAPTAATVQRRVRRKVSLAG